MVIKLTDIKTMPGSFTTKPQSDLVQQAHLVVMVGKSHDVKLTHDDDGMGCDHTHEHDKDTITWFDTHEHDEDNAGLLRRLESQSLLGRKVDDQPRRATGGAQRGETLSRPNSTTRSSQLWAFLSGTQPCLLGGGRELSYRSVGFIG
jgi:hypothetical protein